MTSPRERALAWLARFRLTEWRESERALTQLIGDGDEELLFAIHEACPAGPLLAWVRQAAWRGAGVIADAGALRRFLERAKNPPSFEVPSRPRLSDGPARNLGAMLAQAHDDELLERELEHFGPEPALQNLFACWVQERVVRGSRIGGSAFVQQFWPALPLAHPLRGLPLELLPIEAGLAVEKPRRFETRGSSFSYDDGLEVDDDFEPEGEWVTPFVELPARPFVLAAIVSDPGLCPNSNFEGRVFQLRAGPASLRALSLRALRLECLGAHPARVKARSERSVLCSLLTVASLGGANGEARSNAFGRLLAWRSFTALVGLPEGAALGEVVAEAAQTQWLSFETTGPWFGGRVSLDLGVVALRPDNSIAVLATTDPS